MPNKTQQINQQMRGTQQMSTDIVTEVVATGMPRIGDPAPDFTAVTTQGDINFRETTRVVGSSCSATRPTSRRCAPASS